MRATLAALAVVLAFPAWASNCGPRDQVIAMLADDYHETRQAIALNEGGAVMEIWAILESGSWTITVTTPNGLTCLVGAGQAYETVAEAPGIDG